MKLYSHPAEGFDSQKPDETLRKAADLAGNLIEQLTNGKETRRPVLIGKDKN
jgi:hypothetical protein